MKRSCGSDGKRGTMSGFSFDGATPLQATCSVIHTGLPPLASFILAAMSPTTLMSALSVSACRPGGYAIGKMSTPVMSNAGR